jgi:hypothetical protein
MSARRRRTSKRNFYEPIDDAQRVGEVFGARGKLSSRFAKIPVALLTLGRTMQSCVFSDKSKQGDFYMPTETKIHSLEEFLNEVESLDMRSHLDLRGLAVEANEADKIKNRVFDFYKGIESAHCFCDESGQVFDSIPWTQYPTVKALGQEKIEPPPAIEPSISTTDDREALLPPQLSPGKKDQHGREMYCESGMVAMRRFSLLEFAERDSDIYRYSNKKSKDDGHRYAHASRAVKNRGLGCTLNVWAPQLAPQIKPAQHFSLSQIWCVAGKRADNSLQTVEAGLHVVSKSMGKALYEKDLPYPDLPHLFVYWTPDNYGRKNANKVSLSSYAGSYLELQILKQGFSPKKDGPPKYVPGMAFRPLSVNNNKGSIKVEWMLWRGAWWLNIQDNWIGYYSTSLFGNDGALASSADVIDFGGETCCDLGPPGPTFPQMGSGSKPTGKIEADYGKVAFQRNLFYYKPDGTRESVNLNLSPQSNEPGYGIRVGANQDKEWLNYIFFGGPGGKLPAAFASGEDGEAPAEA